MISPSSLAAFSPVQPASPATRVAATNPARSGTEPAAKVLQALPSGGPQGAPPSRATPRGSLLDLSV